MTRAGWEFFIDVGGTFTDVVAYRPDGAVITYKLLSSGAQRGVVEHGSTSRRIKDSRRIGEPEGFWSGYSLSLVHARPTGERVGQPAAIAKVVASRSETGELLLDRPLAPGSNADAPTGAHATAYELRSHEEAPVVAIRYLMGLGLSEPIGPVEVRLGTTRATNALLERKGARVAFVTTKGFGDILTIGNQDRPKLFELDIRKRDELAVSVIEIDERISASGKTLRAPDEKLVRRQLEDALRLGVEALAICLLHSYVNPAHEEMVASAAESVGFERISVSSRVARLERIVSRGDTTTADAYLSGVIRSYVGSLRASLPQARLALMTSSGGLADASSAAPKDTILSGPAGGVVGCAHVARQADFDRVIGFDMGGTSTDVSRVDPPPRGFEYEYETVKAGVRLMTPMLAVETVAAGGGSICRFDGQKLVVGPQSAGADPGPASYGRGGPLTVTDMNVMLGRVVPEHFPFQLDRRIVKDRLEALAHEINTMTGSSLGPIELAEGFVRIANANMAAAIKRISIAKGYDVREYALNSFGGAGGQHACAIARMLGISRVMFSPFAGVLSALGISVADVKRIGQRSVCRMLDEGVLDALRPEFEAITEELRNALIGEGLEPERLRPAVCTMDLCYAGQATLITVPAGPWERAAGRFEKLHRQLYGYCHEGRAIEVRVVRVELTGGSPGSASPLAKGGYRGVEQAASTSPGPSLPRRVVHLRADEASLPSEDLANFVESPHHTDMVVDGKLQVVPVHLRSGLDTGHRLRGPAIVIEETSTIVVEPAWEAAVGPAGEILLTNVESAPAAEAVSREADPIQLELFNNQFAAVAEQMGTTLRRTALSTNVKERLDYSCAIFTHRGDLVVNAPHIPVHLGAMGDCVKALIEDVGVFSPGDVYITNDPYRGGSHLNDVTVVTPVHDDRGERITFFVASRAHHAEIGGTRPGSMPPDSTSLAEEGVVIRAFPWIQDGRPRHEQLWALLTAPPYPSRAPDENLADIAAQAAANQRGVCDLQGMIERYGLDIVQAYMRHIQAAAERKMRSALARLDDGMYRFEDRLDDGSPIRVAITIKGDRARIDFTGTGPVLVGNLNANRAIVSSAVLYCLRCLIDEDIPLNAGVLAPIEIVLPECLLNPKASGDPRKCPAVAGGNVETSQRVVDAIFGALGTVAAGQGTMNNILCGQENFGYYETICGGAGAGPGFHGADAVHTHMTNTRLTDPEVLESRYPIRLVRFAIRRGSGGNGRYRGGDGVVRELEFLEPLEVSILSQRRTTAPYGLRGGGHGQMGRNLLQRAVREGILGPAGGLGSAEELPPIAHVTVQPGDRLTIETPGGGGFYGADE